MLIPARPIASALLAAALLVAGCDEPAASKPPAASASSAAKPAPQPSASAEAPAAPTQEALQTARLKKTLRCAATSSGGPCNVLNDFEKCQPHKLVSPGGEGRWIGRGYRVKGTNYVEEYLMMRSRRVPLTEVGKGQLPAKIAVARIPEEEQAAYRHAPKAVNRFARDDVPKPNNAALLYLKRFKDWSESYATLAEDNQVYVNVDDGAYLCQLVEHQRLLLVNRSTSSSGIADGLYAELFPATW